MEEKDENAGCVDSKVGGNCDWSFAALVVAVAIHGVYGLGLPVVKVIADMSSCAGKFPCCVGRVRLTLLLDMLAGCCVLFLSWAEYILPRIRYTYYLRES